MKHFAIADIHGCFDTLQALLNQLPLQAEDQLVFLGDYVDRGPKSYDVLKFVSTHKGIYLKGNHEDFYLEYLSNPNNIGYVWFRNGGLQTIQSFKKNNAKLTDFTPFLLSCLLYHETDQSIYVHGGFNKTLEQSTDEDLLWSRAVINFTNKTIICGHTIHSQHFIKAQAHSTNVVHVDNGVFIRGDNDRGNLVAYCPEDKQFWFQHNIDL